MQWRYGSAPGLDVPCVHVWEAENGKWSVRAVIGQTVKALLVKKG